MDKIKNYVIATLTGLLVLSLFTQPAQSAAKTYDAAKLAQYTACLANQPAQGYNFSAFSVSQCSGWKP
jgi:hypothetical protein